MKHLIEGAYDLHVHCAPDVMPRKMDDWEMAGRITSSGMAGYAIKSHYFCTSERATMVKAQFPACDAVGTLSLNAAVGGINPIAVEMAARSGIRLVWFPTCDAANEREHLLKSDPDKKLPYWAKLLFEMENDGIKIPPISVFDETGELSRATHEVLDVIAKYNIVLATGHISREETFALVKAAKEHRVEKIIITHVDFPATFYSVEEQEELARYGAFMEHCYMTYATEKVAVETTLAQIRALGAERVIIDTDLGQPTGPYPDEGLLAFAAKLHEGGFSDEEIRIMAVKNPSSLVQ